MVPDTTPLTPTTLQVPWGALPTHLRINTSVPQMLYKDQQYDIVKKALTMALLVESFPEESGIQSCEIRIVLPIAINETVSR